MQNKQNQYEREALLIGEEGVEKLRKARVCVFGVGGVGGYVVEALARSGVGALDLVDSDEVALTNLNRQIIALHSTIGRPKCEVAADRIHDIDPDTVVTQHRCFFLPDDPGDIDFSSYDAVVDAIDTVAGKLAIAKAAEDHQIPCVSVMGCGNRLDPTKLVVSDIYDTREDPLARVMRRECRKRGIKKLTVVYSTEPALTPHSELTSEKRATGRPVPGSTAFVPPAAGLIAASLIVKALLS